MGRGINSKDLEHSPFKVLEHRTAKILEHCFAKILEESPAKILEHRTAKFLEESHFQDLYCKETSPPMVAGNPETA